MSESEACALATMEWKNGVPVNLNPRKETRLNSGGVTMHGDGSCKGDRAYVRGIHGGLDGDSVPEPCGEGEGRRVVAEEHDADVSPERQPRPHRQLLPLR